MNKIHVSYALHFILLPSYNDILMKTEHFLLYVVA